MAHGFDELVNFLLDEVALRFAEGASLDDFKGAVKRFYAQSQTAQTLQTAVIDQTLLINVDHSLLEKAWTWLLVHSDVWVGKSTEQDDVLPEILVTGDQNATALSLRDAEAVDAAADRPTGQIRLWTSHERVWQTVAGHGVDFKRVPGEEFRLLCMIAAAGEKGVAQPDLVKQSKQDKKSVPGRTDNLHKAGYIRKTRILAEKHNTSLLTHRKFVPKDELEALAKPVFVNGSLSFDNLLEVLKEKLKNGKPMKMDDLEESLGCAVKSWEKRALWRALERLDIIGVVQRYRQDEPKPGKNGKMRVFKTKTIKLLREPTEDDHKRYTSLTVKDRNDFRKRLEAQDAETQGEHADHMEEDDYAPLNPTMKLDEDSEAPTQEEGSIVWKMRWESDTAWTNTVFNAVEGAGTKGLSSMAARGATYGQFYDRPVEQMLARLTDVWQNAQPDHLSHFSIIRDTDTKGRSTNYLYRTHEAFQAAVDAGHTVWENATNGADYQKPQPKLDRFGFSTLDPSQFIKNGNGSLADVVRDAGFEADQLQKTDPIIERKADGSLGVAWNHNQGKRKPRKSKVEQLTNDGEVDETPAKPKPKPKPKPEKKPRKKKNNESAESTQTLLSQTDTVWRMKAEQQAYEEAQKRQKKTPILTLPGKPIKAIWQVGRGRSKMILVNESVPAETEFAPEQITNTKKPPIVVLESRVQEILASIQPADPVPAESPATPQICTPTRKQQHVVALQSPRLKELGWFNETESPQQASTDGPYFATPHPNEVQETQATTGASVEMQDAGTQEKRTDSTRAESLAALQQVDGTMSPETARDAVTPGRRRSSITQENSNGDWLGQLQDAADQTPASKPRVGDTHPKTGNPRKDWAQRQSTYIRPPPQVIADRKKRGTVVGRGTAQYKRILLIKQIMEKSDGIFPGDSEMVPAFQKLQKMELKSQTTSDRDTVMKAVKALVEDGKLMRFAFFFKDKNGKETQKWIIHEPHIVVDSPEVKDLMKKIEEAHPRNYVPPPYGDGETGRGEQRKNIDRFQYRPGKSIIQPSGTEFVIDIEAKRKELENQRLAAAAAIRAEEMRRLKAQAVRNKKRNAAIARKPRRLRTLLQKTAQPDESVLEQMQEDDPDAVMQSVETDGLPIAHRHSGRPRYRDIRPAPPMLELQIAKLDSGVPIAPAPAPATVPPPPAAVAPAMPITPAPVAPVIPAAPASMQPLAPIGSRVLASQPALPFPRPREQAGRLPSRPPLPLPGGQVLAWSGSRRGSREQARRQSKYNRQIVVAKPKKSEFTFRETQGPDFYDQFYEIQDVSTLVQPVQRFHPNTGTFSTDFFIRTNVRQSQWVQPTQLSFEHYTSTKPADVQMFMDTDDYDNHYHPDKQARLFAPGLLSKKPIGGPSEPQYDSDVDFPNQAFEKKELKIMREEFPDLLHEPLKDGFISYTFGGEQQTAEELYGYGIRPMEHIVLHGADPEDFPDVQFEENNRRPVNPIEYTADTSSEDEDDHVPSPRAFNGPKRARRSRKVASDSAEQQYVDEAAAPTPASTKKASRTGGTQSGQCQISTSDSRRLFFACIAVRVIQNNLESNINWGLIQQIFEGHPNYDTPTFKARWNRMWNTHNDVARRMEHEFRDAFADAYAADLVPTLDVMHGNYLTYKKVSSWNRVVDWAVKSIPVFSDEIGLPATRDELGEGFQFKVEPDSTQDDREKMEHIHTTHAKREDLAHAANFHAPLPVRPRASIKDEEVVRSWIRANCAISDDDCDADAVNQKMQQLDQGLVVTLTKEMHADKLIAHNFKLKNKAARNYHLSDQYNQLFNKRPLEAANFTEALAFKCELDKVFATDSSLLLDFHIPDGAAMVITEMQAAGRISVKHVLPPVDSTIGAPWPRLTVWGFNEGQYKLRNMDRKTFTWGVEIVPTDKYVKGLPAKVKAEKLKPPRHPKQDRASHGRIPLWYDVQGNFIPEWWEAIMRSTIQHMAMRSGSSSAVLAAAYRGLIWEWEIDVLVDWLIDVGVAERSETGAIRTKEWWWMVVPQTSSPEQEGHKQPGNDAGGAVEEEDSPAPAPKKRRVRGAKA